LPIRPDAAATADLVAAIRNILDETAAAHQRFACGGPQRVAAAVVAIRHALGDGRKLLAFGNGGSAADAQHLAAELVGRFETERRPMAALALTADAAVTTAVSNDYGYEQVFARQIEALGQAGDVAVGISTSGRSRNVEAGLLAAKARGMTTIALTGCDGGRVGVLADIHLNVPEASRARVQEVHRTLIHVLCEVIESDL
jgi:D-sedoheptulose 7-phosphate isomerase